MTKNLALLVLLGAVARGSLGGEFSFSWPVVTPYPGSNGSQSLSLWSREEIFRPVRSQAEWNAMWNTLRIASVEPRPTAPNIDFGKFTMLVAALGTRPTGGYAVRIGQVLDDGTTIHVSVFETRPGKNCVVTTALTYPIDIALIPHTELPVLFEVEAADHDCST